MIITFNSVFGNMLVIHSPFQGHRTYWSMKVDGTCCVLFVARQPLRLHADSLPPANKVCEGYVFTGVCLSTWGGLSAGSWGECMVAPRGVHGCCQGGCMVAGGGHACLLVGGMHVCSGGAGHVWLLQGACMVAPGGMRGCSGGVCVVAAGGACIGYDEIRRYDPWAGGTHPTGMHSCFPLSSLDSEPGL